MTETTEALETQTDQEQVSENISAASDQESQFLFTWGDCWKQCTEYHVADFDAEMEFFRDLLGFPINGVGDGFAMFTSPDQAFYLSISQADAPSTGLRLQFMIENILDVSRVLEARGVRFEETPHPWQEGSPLYTGIFLTPNGIPVDLWGMVTP